MIKNIRTKQAILIGAVVLLVAFLFTRDIKGLVKPKEETSSTPAGGSMGTQAPATAEINLKEISTVAKNTINASLAAEIVTLENAYNSASEDKKSCRGKIVSKEMG